MKSGICCDAAMAEYGERYYDNKEWWRGGLYSSDLLRLNSFKFELLIQTNSKIIVFRFNIRGAPFFQII